jgi:CubicO group peptidase (beta-lactamase class C family)
VPGTIQPGTGKRHSNPGFVVLGAIIEAVTGESYYDYVRENIFSPAGMNRTDSYELDQIVPDLESGYTVIVLSNYDPPVAEEFGGRLFRLLRKAKKG